MGVSFVTVAALAATQNGRITSRQLRARGFGNSSIESAVRLGHLHRVHRGVYAVGHVAPSPLGDWHAAVLAGGPGAVLSHRSAATLLRIRDGVGPRIDVTVPAGGHARAGIAFHRSKLEPWEVTEVSHIPTTSPARTLVDLAHALDDPDAVEWAAREMQFRRLFDRRLLELANHRWPDRTVTRILESLAPTGSRLEVAFLSRVVRRHRLPEPQSQVRLEGFRVDFFWPQARLVVEVDGKAHDEPAMRQADAVRDNVLQLAGYVVLRYRWADVHRRDAQTARQIRRALADSHPRPG